MLKQLLRRAFRVSIVMSLSILAGCGTNGRGTSSAPHDSNGNSGAVTSPAPTPAAAPAPSPTIAGEVAIADNFTTDDGLKPSYGTGAIAPVSPDPVSGFRFMCKPGQLLRDDPVVYPGQAGASHLHQFWGNTGANANSNYQSLRTTGQSTCDNRGTDTAVNRSAYWTPAMLDGAGNVVKPDFINTYYKQLPHSQCSTPPSDTSMGICVDIPNGLRFVFGYNMANGKGGPLDLTSQDHYVMWFECWNDLTGTPNATAKGQFHSIAEVVNAGCPANAVLVMQGVIPICWDGKNLDSPDHRSHIAQLRGDVVPVRCPDDHPYVLPSLQMRLHYTTDANFVAGKWHLSSDEMAPNMPAGGTFHMDYFEAWSPTVKDAWFRNCIDKHLTCANGDLGNGLQMKDAGVPVGGWTRHQLVAVP